MTMPISLWSIPWGHQHLQFIEHTRFELVTLNLPSYKNEIHLWFTSLLLYSNKDTLQHRVLHDSRIFGLWPVSVSLLPPSRRLRSLLKLASRSSLPSSQPSILNSNWFVSCMKSFLSILIHNSISYASFPIWDYIYTHELVPHSHIPCLLSLIVNILLI